MASKDIKTEAGALARSFRDSLRPGPHGNPIVIAEDEGAFLVRGDTDSRIFMVTVRELSESEAHLWQGYMADRKSDRDEEDKAAADSREAWYTAHEILEG